MELSGILTVQALCVSSCFFMTNPKHRYRNKADVNFTVKNIGKAFITNSKADHFVKRYRDKFDMNDFKDVISKTGKIYYGMPVCGKSWWLCKLIYKNRDKCIVLSHTNKAVSNIKNILQTNHKMSLEEVNKLCHTFESYFYDNVRGIDDLKEKIVYVDEYTMTPNRFMTLLYQAFTKLDITVIMSGDNNQCDPINKNGLLHYDYFNDSKSVSEMCPGRDEMKYIKGSTRYEKETKTILDNFLKYKNLRHTFKPIGEYYKNICYTNKTRRRVTKESCERYVQEKVSHEVNFLYDAKLEKYKVCVVMPVIATTNIKKYEMYNMMEFEIEHINKDSNGVLIFTVNKQQFTIHEFRKSVLPNFCNTIYKYQGGTIYVPYNIWDTEKMDSKELYTSLSRTTKLEYIHLDNNKIRSSYGQRQQNRMSILNLGIDTEYHNGKIYQITFEKNDKIYVGCRTQLLEDRLDEHKLNQKSAIYKYRADNPKIDLICLCPCKDKKTLEKIENSYINEYKQKYGDDLLNIKGVKKVKEIKNKFKVKLETQKQLEQRLERKLRIKDDTKRSYLEIDALMDGKRIKHKRRYNKDNKQNQYQELSKIQQKLVQDFTVVWN